MQILYRHYMTEGGKIRAGQAIKHEGGLYRVRKAQSVKPGKGGTYNQLELQDMRTGTKTSARFSSKTRTWQRNVCNVCNVCNV